MVPRSSPSAQECKGLSLIFSPAAGLVHFYNVQLQKSPSQIFGQNSGNSVDISKAFFERGIWKFESSQVELAEMLLGGRR
jgi:hypothetical protein